MNIDYITNIDSPNFGYPDGRHGTNRPNKIIIHHWGSDASTWEGTISHLCNPAPGGDPDSAVSAHFVVEAGRVCCLVNLSDAAWHGGGPDVNQSSIGIECNPRCSEDDIETVAQLIAGLWRSYGTELPLYGHRDVARTECPGRWYGKLEELTRRAHEINHPETYYVEISGLSKDEADLLCVLLKKAKKGKAVSMYDSI